MKTVFVFTVKAYRLLVDGDYSAPCSLADTPVGIFLNRFDQKHWCLVTKRSSLGKCRGIYQYLVLADCLLQVSFFLFSAPDG